jgi:dihydrofolate reductase
VPKVTVVNHVTLDGVMQAPARADEDTSDGFEHGGWAAPNTDQVMGEAMASRMRGDGAMLFGRRTYQDLFESWAGRTDNPFTEVFERSRKYVASTTLSEPLPWVNSTLLSDDVTAAVAQLKQHTDLGILGSGALIQSLMLAGLVDEFLLLIHPLVLGTGRRLFTDPGAAAALRLTESTITTTGVVIATYAVTA